jgi:PIN domain nuclease of toxin-antitoxin system
MPLAEVIASQQQRNRLDVLAVELQHVLALEQLPAHHKDPFDRLLVAQALVEGAVLVSKDPVFAGYPITVHW